MHADGDNIIILYYCHQRSSFISHAIHHTELHNLFITAILCFICIFLIFAMSVSHHTSLSVRDRFTCLFDAVVAIMTIAVMALLLFSSFSIAFFFVVVAIFVFVIIALLWYCNVAFLALQFSWYSQCLCGSSGHRVNLKPSPLLSRFFGLCKHFSGCIFGSLEALANVNS